MSKNVSRNSRRSNSTQDLLVSTPFPSAARGRAPTVRELKRAEERTQLEIEKMEMVLAAGRQWGNVDLPARVPHYRKQLEKQRSASLIARVLVLFVITAAVVGWLNQKFHFWN
jgi:hypothetical protein